MSSAKNIIPKNALVIIRSPFTTPPPIITAGGGYSNVDHNNHVTHAQCQVWNQSRVSLRVRSVGAASSNHAAIWTSAHGRVTIIESMPTCYACVNHTTHRLDLIPLLGFVAENKFFLTKANRFPYLSRSNAVTVKVSTMYPPRLIAVNILLERGWCRHIHRWPRGRIEVLPYDLEYHKYNTS
jgi:hypothetical protein